LNFTCLILNVPYLEEIVQHSDDGIPTGLDIQLELDLLALLPLQLVLKVVVLGWRFS